MNLTRLLYDKIKTLAYLQKQLSTTDDCESIALELKAAVSDKKKCSHYCV